MPIDTKEAKRYYEEAKTIRTSEEDDWKMACAYCLPKEYGKWLNAAPPYTGGSSAVKRFAYDNRGANAIPKYGAILQRLATPDSQKWHKLGPSDTNLLKSYRVRSYYDELNDLLFKMRYNPYAGFVAATGEIYQNIGVYGNGPVRANWRKARPGIAAGFNYSAIAMRNVFVIHDDDGNSWMTIVRFWLTAPQFKRKWPNEPPPKSVAAELLKGEKASNTEFFEFVHIVYPRDASEYKPNSLGPQRHTHVSLYLAVRDEEFVGKESGYAGNPYMMPRAASSAENPYGNSPAVRALPSLGSASAMRKTLLKQGQKAVDPTLLAYDDGVLSGKVAALPGRVLYGGLNNQGNELVKPLATGANFTVGEKMLEDERADIDDAFLVWIFQLLMESRGEMTATEVMELAVKEAMLLAPTMGRLQVAWLEPNIQREVNMLVEYAPQMLPEMPPELEEAGDGAKYDVTYTSPLAKGMYAEEDAGFLSVHQIAVDHATATGEPDALDLLDIEAALPEIAQHRNVPERWMRSPEKMAAKREQRNAAKQSDQLVQAGPAIASVANGLMKTGGGSPAVKGIVS